MLQYPTIDPVALKIGILSIHWYGIMYLLGILMAWFLLSRRAASRGFTQEQLSDLVFYAALGVIIGGRVGYMLFYVFSDFIHHPLMLFKIWDGGMAFHGGFLGVVIAMIFYARHLKISWLDLTDFIAPVVPLGLGAGRIGNFINSELWGRVTDAPWGMVFPNGGDLPRHPSQLYEFALEGVAMFLILWFFSIKPRPRAAVSGLFLLCYGCFRFFVEFFRVPDVQVGYLALGWLTEGQVLSFPMIIAGIGMILWAYTGVKRCSST